MNLRIVIAAVALALGLATAAWLYRGSAPVTGLARAVGVPTESSTPLTAATLQAAGVHKCVGAGGIRYLDGSCPKGSHEVAANGGTMTVTSFPAALRAVAQASGVLGGALVKPMDPEERDRLRDKAVDDAGNRR